MGNGSNDYLFQRPQKFPDICVKFFEVEDRITHQLLRPMKRNITPTINFKIINPFFSHFGLRNQYVFHMTAFSQGVHRRMFNKQQPVNGWPAGSRGIKILPFYRNRFSK
jgi:hypothetical protein